MKGSSLAAFVIASILLCFMGVHYTYYLLFGPQESVLNDYLEQQIKAAESLDELVAQYEESLQLVKAYQSDHDEIESEFFVPLDHLSGSRRAVRRKGRMHMQLPLKPRFHRCV